MSKYFGKRSNDNLDTCHIDLQLINRTAIKTIRVDYTVICGARTFEKQLEAFITGNSKLDPRIPSKLLSAMHVITEDRPMSMAIDIIIAEKFRGKSLTWDNLHLTYVCAYLIATADRLFDEGKITHKLQWGGNWDMDGIIQIDQNFDDNGHLQLYKP